MVHPSTSPSVRACTLYPYLVASSILLDTEVVRRVVFDEAVGAHETLVRRICGFVGGVPCCSLTVPLPPSQGSSGCNSRASLTVDETTTTSSAAMSAREPAHRASTNALDSRKKPKFVIVDADVTSDNNINGSKPHPAPTRSVNVGYDELEAPAAFVRTKVYAKDHMHE